LVVVAGAILAQGQEEHKGALVRPDPTPAATWTRFEGTQQVQSQYLRGGPHVDPDKWLQA